MSGDAVAWEAAQLALFALRSTIHPTMPIVRDAYAVAPDREVVLRADAVVARFVEAPKPLICAAVASSRGVVVIALEPPKTRGLRQLGFAATLGHLEQMIRNPSQSLGVAIESMARKAGETPENVRILCVGRDEMRIFSWSAIARWEREYGAVGSNYSLRLADDPTALDQRPYREAQARGAASFLRFGGLSGVVAE